MFHATAGGERHSFPTLAALMAQATPLRSGDQLAGLAAPTQARRVAGQMALADLPLRTFLTEAVIPYEQDEVTRLIIDTHDAAAFAPVSHLTVGGFRDWLLSDAATTPALTALGPGLTPEMVAAVAKIMRLQDLMVVASRLQVTTRFRTTIGLPGRLSTRLQPNHPADDPRGIAASILDGLLLGAGDACIGINPATDSPERTRALLELLDDIRQRLAIPMQSCVLAHVTTTLGLMERGAPVDLVFQSVAGTQAANRGFGIDLALLDEAHAAARALGRGENVMYFETGQGSALSANAHHGVDQQTCEARAYAVARRYRPLLVNTVVGFIGPEYLADGKQITRAGLEDHFCGKLLGLPMGCDVCYTNHAEADQDDMDGLLTLLVAAGVTFVMGVPGADDIMLGYQSTSFHDALATRELLGRRPAPEFETWLDAEGLMTQGRVRPPSTLPTTMRALASPLPLREGPGVGPPPSAVAAASHWPALRTHTAARIGLSRSGASLATPPLLDFRLAHAKARDAVHATLDEAALLMTLPGPVQVVHSQAPDRHAYLLRPDLGRHLAVGAAADLAREAGAYDLVIVLADGLSATALQRQAAPLVAALLPALQAARWAVAPLVLVNAARVAVGDEVAQALGAAAVLVLIGERPGLTAPDSLGAYLTWGPTRTTTDADRNCVSNIRPEGLPIAEAAHRLHALLVRMRTLHVSGIALKDESERASLLT